METIQAINSSLSSFSGHKNNIHLRGVDEIPGDLDITNYQIVSLEGCPKIVRGNFKCGDNQFENLAGGPEVVDGSYSVLNYNQNDSLKSLDGIAKRMGSLRLAKCKSLHSLEPLMNSTITSSIAITECETISSFAYLPNNLSSLQITACNLNHFNDIKCMVRSQSGFECSVRLNHNNIKSLVNIHHAFPIIDGKLMLYSNPLEEGWLYLFFIKGLHQVDFGPKFRLVQPTINRYIRQGKAGLVKAQLELISKGLDEAARM